jgi:predicted RNA-binding protein with PUA-like domain
MTRWLLKTEPSEYSFDDLERDQRTAWGGVANPVALKHLRAMAAGELAIVYHTGSQKRAVGVARVVAAGDPPMLAPVKRLAQPVPLAEIKRAPAFADSPLVKIGRLSVVPLDAAQWRTLLALARTPM